MRYLFIAEKPSLMRDVQAAYKTLKSPGYDADFMCFRGHFMELNQPDQYTSDWGKPWTTSVLPMIPEKFKYTVKADCKTEYSKIKAALASKKYDCVVNACDAGREGEAIFWTCYNHMGFKLPAKRLWAQDTTIETIAKALKNLLDYSSERSIADMRDASFRRMEFDWLIGMNLSRAATLQTRKLIPVGRVKTPTLAIVVKRDLEIANFKPSDYFEIEAEFEGYSGHWFDPDTKETSFKTKAEADKLVAKLGKTGTVESVVKEKVTTLAPPLYSLAELQKEANKAFGFTANQTLEIAQSLYEKHKILSYPRTESQALSTAMGKDLPKHLEALKDVPEVSKFVKLILANPDMIDRVCKNKKYVDNKKVTDHTAIINTKLKPDLNKLTVNEKRLFIMVIKKFVSIFLDPCISDKTTIITDINGEKFKTVGSITVQKGFKELASSTEKAEPEIPNVKEKQTVAVKKIDLLAKATQPPKPYTDASLLDAMQNAGKFSSDKQLKAILTETKGLGTSATRAGILEDLINKNLLERKGKTLRATEFGIKVIEILGDKDITSPDLTAVWETKLQDIEDGKMKSSDFTSQMVEYTKKATADFLATLKALSSADTKELVGTCPVCGKRVIATSKYYLCEAYKNEDKGNCTFAFFRKMGKTEIKIDDFKKILEGGVSKQYKFVSKAGKPFSAALKYDKEQKKIVYAFDEGNKTLGKCPKCGKDFVTKGGAYACTDKECNFFIAKSIRGANITETDAKNLISGKSTSAKKFTGGKGPWYAKLKYNSDYTKLEFEFDNSKKPAAKTTAKKTPPKKK